MLETTRNSRYNARGWVTMAGALVVLRALTALRQRGESKPRLPLWKHFDDTHHWDSSAEEWVPNDDRATLYASRTPNSETQDPSR